MIRGNIEVTKKKLLELAEILGAVEIKAGDLNFVQMRMRCVAYSSGVYGCSGRLYQNEQGKFFVAKSRNAACYFGN